MYDIIENKLNIGERYEEYYVAFIDILGFKNLIIDNPCDMIYSLLSSNFKRPFYSMDGQQFSLRYYEDVKYVVFSDSICYYVSAKKEFAFFELLTSCKELQEKLLRFKNIPVLCRGGIAKGKFYANGNMIFGQALVDAVELEAERSNMIQEFSCQGAPRIVIQDNINIKKEVDPTGKNFDCYISKDEDHYVIDYWTDFCEFGDFDNVKKVFEIIKKKCTDEDKRIASKYVYLQEKMKRMV